MSEQLYVREFNIPLSANKTVTIKIAEPKQIRAQNLNLQTWTSSFLLAGLLHRLDDVHVPANVIDGALPVLELGAGTGLVGITAAALWGAHTVLTDLEPIVPGLERNAALNQELLQALHPTGAPAVLCGSLDWYTPDVLSLSKSGEALRNSGDYTKASLIFAADTVYSEEQPELLSKTIARWLAPGTTSRAIIMYPLRVAYLDLIRELWEAMESCGFEAVQEGKEQAEEREDSWDDELLCEWSVWKWKAPAPNN